jgi:uncharacterized membrane protein
MKRVVITVLIAVAGFCGSVQQSYPRTVMIDSYHCMENVNVENNTAAIRALLPQFTFEVRDEALTEDLLKKYDVVMLYEPYTTLGDDEIQVLRDFVWDGGGLIICGEHDVGWNDPSRATYNRLALTFGVTFTSSAVDDPTNKRGCYCTPIIHNMKEHPIMEGVAEIVLYKPCSLRITGNAIALARGDDDSRTVGKDVIEGEDIIVVAVSEYNKGRVEVVGSSSVFGDSFINYPNNQEFCINSFQWVSEQAIPESNPWTTLVPIIVIACILVILIVVKKKLQNPVTRE